MQHPVAAVVDEVVGMMRSADCRGMVGTGQDQEEVGSGCSREETRWRRKETQGDKQKSSKVWGSGLGWAGAQNDDAQNRHGRNAHHSTLYRACPSAIHSFTCRARCGTYTHTYIQHTQDGILHFRIPNRPHGIVCLPLASSVPCCQLQHVDLHNC